MRIAMKPERLYASAVSVLFERFAKALEQELKTLESFRITFTGVRTVNRGKYVYLQLLVDDAAKDWIMRLRRQVTSRFPPLQPIEEVELEDCNTHVKMLARSTKSRTFLMCRSARSTVYGKLRLKEK
eukprot:766865-Hanusia_phi.AAC.10